MSLFRRMYTTVFAQVDQMVGEIENHDALIKAAIAEQRKKVAMAKVQLARLQASEQRVSRQMKDLEDKEKSWTRRAVDEANDDEAQALVCLQRRQRIREQLARLGDNRETYNQAARKMSADIARCEEQLSSLGQKHELMRARQSGADALNIINEVSGSSIDELETSFERWEVKIAQGEIGADSFDPVDTLEDEYLGRENEAALRAELSELLREEKDNGTH